MAARQEGPTAAATCCGMVRFHSKYERIGQNWLTQVQLENWH